LLTLAFGILLVCAGSGGASSRATAKSDPAAIRYLSHVVQTYQEATWHWQRVMGVPRTPSAGRVLARMSTSDLGRAARLWRTRAAELEQRAQHPPHLREWLCIHRFEADWRDRAAPYWGGLQMDITFQRRYGPMLLRTKGTADHWTPLEQIWVAERARRTRGFWPWPNTARACGLLA
jgi:hypothetical protein